MAQSKDRSWKDYAVLGVFAMIGLSMCGNAAENMSAGGTAKAATVGAATAAGAAGAYGCSKVGVKTCLGGGGGGGGGSKKADKEEPTAATQPEAPPATNPPTPEPEPEPTPAPSPTPGTTPGGIILPPGVDLDRAPNMELPAETGIKPCAPTAGLGGIQIQAMGEC